MYQLYWEYMAGSIVAQAMLEESSADYGLCHVDMAADEHLQLTYKKINPTSRVPALALPDGTTVGETAAIVVFLGEQFPEKRLTPLPGDSDRATFLFWLNVMATSGYLTVARWAHPERYASDPNAVQQVEEKAALDLRKFFGVMEEAIAGDPFFLARGFSALDIYLTMLTEWHSDRAELFADFPSLAKIADNVRARPAYEKAIRTHELPSEAA